MYLTVPTDDLCPEPFSKKPKSFRANLQLDDSDRGSVESPRIKAIKSAQNCTAKKFVFPTGQRCREIVQTLHRLHSLEQQKKQLVKELGRLKQGALNALMEKDQTIEKLKQKIDEVQSDHSRDSQGILRDEYDVMLRIRETEAEMEMLAKEREDLRQEHISTIIKKDKIIVEIGQELEETKCQLTELEIKDSVLAQSLTKVEQRNLQLYDELRKSKTSIVELRNSLRDSQLLSRSQTPSVVSSPLRKMSASTPFNLNTQQSRETDVKRSQKFYMTKEKMKEMNQVQSEMHSRELDNLKQYYQDLVMSASVTYRGLSIPTEQNEHIVVNTIPTEENLQSNESVNESDDQQKSDLKNEIRLMELEHKMMKHLVENPEKRLPTCASAQENQSQFSYKHFQYEVKNSQKDSMFFSRKEQTPLQNTSRYSVTSNLTSYSRRRTREKAKIREEMVKEGVKLGLIAGGICISIGFLVNIYRSRQ